MVLMTSFRPSPGNRLRKVCSGSRSSLSGISWLHGRRLSSFLRSRMRGGGGRGSHHSVLDMVRAVGRRFVCGRFSTPASVRVPS